LVRERLEEMEVPPINDRDVHRGVAHLERSLQPTETPTYDDHLVSRRISHDQMLAPSAVI